MPQSISQGLNQFAYAKLISILVALANFIILKRAASPSRCLLFSKKAKREFITGKF